MIDIIPKIRNENGVSRLENTIIRNLNDENILREIKQANKSCPYNLSGLCLERYIRCGERQSYSSSEEYRSQSLKCNYNPQLENKGILIVDDNETHRNVYADFFIEGFDVDENLVKKASSIKEAEDILRQEKIDNNQIGVVLSDIDMPGGNGYQLVNHIVERNLNCRILLMSGNKKRTLPPPNYLGDHEIIPGEKAVYNVLQKPISIDILEIEFKKIQESFRKAA